MSGRWIVVGFALVLGATGGVASARPLAAAEPGITVTFLPAPATIVGRRNPTPIRVSNTWPGKAVGVTLTVQTPAWVRVTGRGCVRRRQALVCLIQDLRSGEGVTVRLQVTPTKPGAYRIVAQAAAKTVQSTGAGSEAARSPAAAVGFRGSILRVSATLARRMTGVSWRPGCPVGFGDLRVLRVSYWDFGGNVRTGTLIVNRDAAEPLLRVFGKLFALRFPIRRMTPVDAYGGDDYRSIEADNTSAFNCRAATGSSHWSEHAYGHAVDLDPLENPYVSDGSTSHPASRRYLDRSRRLPGMIHAGDAVVRAFGAEGWGWGGAWSGTRDYQHFSASGR